MGVDKPYGPKICRVVRHEYHWTLPKRNFMDLASNRRWYRKKKTNIGNHQTMLTIRNSSIDLLLYPAVPRGFRDCYWSLQYLIFFRQLQQIAPAKRRTGAEATASVASGGERKDLALAVCAAVRGTHRRSQEATDWGTSFAGCAIQLELKRLQLEHKLILKVMHMRDHIMLWCVLLPSIALFCDLSWAFDCADQTVLVSKLML